MFLFISWFIIITEWSCLMLTFCEITFNRKTLLTSCGCQPSSHPWETFFVCVCFPQLHDAVLFDPNFLSDGFSLYLFCFHYALPYWLSFLSLKQAKYISSQHVWTWYNLYIKFTSPGSAHSCLLLIIQFATQTLPPGEALPVSLSTLIHFFFFIVFICSWDFPMY